MSIENLNRDGHMDLVLVLLIACTDCADFFTYTFLEVANYDNNTFTTTVLVIFSLSVIQFSVTFTAVRKEVKVKSELTKLQTCMDIIFGTKLWSICLVMLTQDLPFLIFRLLLVFYFNNYNDLTVYFYIIKNCILVCLDFYRLYFIVRDFSKSRKVVAPLEQNF